MIVYFLMIIYLSKKGGKSGYHYRVYLRQDKSAIMKLTIYWEDTDLSFQPHRRPKDYKNYRAPPKKKDK